MPVGLVAMIQASRGVSRVVLRPEVVERIGTNLPKLRARDTIETLDLQLRGRGFLRVNRGVIAAIHSIREVEEWEFRHFRLHIEGADRTIPLARRRVQTVLQSVANRCIAFKTRPRECAQ